MYVVKSDFGKGIYNNIMDICNNVDNFFTSNYPNGVGLVQTLIGGTGKIISAYLAIFIIIEGYKILWGGSKQNVQNFMFDTAIKFIFITLALYATGWINLVFEAFSGVKDYIMNTLAGNSTGLYEQIASWGGLMGDFHTEVWEKSGKFEKPISIFIILFAFLGFLFGLFPILKALFINTLSFLLLMILAPVAFYFLIFKSTKNSFSQWFQMVLSNLIAILCLTMCLQILFGYIFSNFKYTDEFYEMRFQFVMLMIFYGILANTMCAMAVSIAEKLTNVSLDGIAGSAVGRAMGLGGIVGGSGVLAARGTLALGRTKAAQGLGKFGFGVAKHAAKDASAAVGRSAVGQAAKSAMGAVKNSSAGKTVGTGINKAKDIASKINEYSKG